MIAPAQALAWTLIHFLWQGTLFALVAWVLGRLLRNHAAEARYAAYYGALCGMLLVAITTFALEWRAIGLPGEAAIVAGSPSFDRGLVAVVAAWAVGVACLAVRTSLAWWHLRALCRRVRPLAGRWPSALARLSRAMGVRHSVSVGESAEADVPMVAGWLRPLIVLPIGMVTRLDVATVEAAIAHELAHVRRWDYLLNLIQTAVETLLFYHPATWWISRKARLEREHCCDDLVVATFDDRLRYAKALTDLESFRHHRASPALAATGGSLMSRIRRILEQPAHGARGVTVARLAIAFAAAVALAPACLDQDLEDVGVEDRVDAEELPSSVRAEPDQQTEEPVDDLGIAWLPPRVAAFAPQILEVAQRHEVDPRLVAIVTLVESGGNPRARSPLGARGLMQLMPATAASIARKRDIAGHFVDRLEDPGYNLDLGTYYLGEQLEAFGSDEKLGDAVELAAAAYNGGEKRLAAHLAGEAELSAETRRYKQLVRQLWDQRDAERSATLEAMGRQQ